MTEDVSGTLRCIRTLKEMMEGRLYTSGEGMNKIQIMAMMSEEEFRLLYEDSISTGLEFKPFLMGDSPPAVVRILPQHSKKQMIRSNVVARCLMILIFPVPVFRPRGTLKRMPLKWSVTPWIPGPFR